MRPENTIEVEEIEPEASAPRHLAWIGVGAVAVLALLALLPTSSSSPPSAAAPATLLRPPTTAERYEISTPIAVAAAFVEAYGDFDTDAAASYLAVDALTSGLGESSDWRLGNRWLEATMFKLVLESCADLETSSHGTRVGCDYLFHRFGSDESGLGPFNGSFEVTVQEGEIVSASMGYEFEEFGPEVWGPFSQWVREAYPTEMPRMYMSRGNPIITEDSIPLWEQRTGEYVELVNSGDAYEARARAICSAAQAMLLEAWKALEEVSDAKELAAESYYEVAAPIMEDALEELQEVAPPESVRARFESDYALLERENDWLRLVGAGVDAEPPPGGPAAHNIQPSLWECTSGG